MSEMTKKDKIKLSLEFNKKTKIYSLRVICGDYRFVKVSKDEKMINEVYNTFRSIVDIIELGKGVKKK